MEPILGTPMILRQLERVSRAATLDRVVVATTDQPGDDLLAATVEEEGYPVVRGNEEDVLDRYHEAAIAHQAATIVRLTADCPLADPDVIDHVVNVYIERSPAADFVSNAISETYPDGLDVEVFTSAALEKAWSEAKLPSEREHVTFYMWKTGKFKVISLEAEEPLGHIRLTVDYPEDLELVRQIYGRLYPESPAFTTQDVLHVIADIGDPVNADVPRNVGWQRAFEEDEQVIGEDGPEREG